MALEKITRQEFGDWYCSLVDNVLKKLDTPKSQNPELKSIEDLLKPSLDAVKRDVEITKILQKENEEPLFFQHDNLFLARNDEYTRIEEYALPSFVFPKSTHALKSKKGTSASGMSYRGLKIPVLVCRAHEQVFHHETQHYLFKLLSDVNKVPCDASQKVLDIRDFWMYKNELLSKLVEGQKPIGYTLNNLRNTTEDSTDYTKKHANMMYDLFPALVEASEKQKINSKDFIKETFLAKNFEELFYEVVEIAKGCKVEKYKFDEINFADKKHEEYFLKHIDVMPNEKTYKSKNPFEVTV